MRIYKPLRKKNYLQNYLKYCFAERIFQLSEKFNFSYPYEQMENYGKQQLSFFSNYI